MPCRASSRARRRWARWLAEGTWPLIGLPSCRYATSSPREGERPLRTAGRGRSLQGLEQIGHFHRRLGAVRALLLHPGQGLVVVLGGQHAVGDGHTGVQEIGR